MTGKLIVFDQNDGIGEGVVFDLHRYLGIASRNRTEDIVSDKMSVTTSRNVDFQCAIHSKQLVVQALKHPLGRSNLNRIITINLIGFGWIGSSDPTITSSHPDTTAKSAVTWIKGLDYIPYNHHRILASNRRELTQQNSK